MTKLVSFLDRAGSYTSLSLSNAATSSNSKSDSAQSTPKRKHKILVLEDFPSLSHPRVRSTLHTTLVRFAESSPPLVSSLGPSSSTSPTQAHPPLVIILSDAGLRADDSTSYSNSREDVLDVRSVLPTALLNSVYVTQIKYVIFCPACQ